MEERQPESDTDFEDEMFDQSPKSKVMPEVNYIEKEPADEFKNCRVDIASPPEKLIFVDQEIKSILTNTEPQGDYSLEPDFRLGYAR